MIYTTRAAWGGPNEPPGHRTAGAKLLVVMHHSYRPHVDCGVLLERERAAVLAMHKYHVEQGWGGIAYNWLVFQSGNIYEGRGWARVGAHTSGRNSASQGICLVIDGNAHAPTAAAIEGVEQVIAEGIRLHHIAPNHSRAPHDRFKQKDCPGRYVKESSLLRMQARPATPSRAIAAMPTLRMGKGGNAAPADERTAVQELQRLLDVGPVTGYFGSITDEAVRRYQRERSLEVDGIVGPVTWSKLLGRG